MFFIFRVFAILFFLLLAGCAELIQPNLKTDIAEFKKGEYVLDKDHAALLFKVEHMGFSKFVGRFNQFDAELNFNPDDLDSAFMNAKIDMKSLSIPDEVFANEIMGKSWLDSERFPYASYRTIRVASHSKTTIEFEGELTFLGLTKPVPLFVTFNGAARNMLTQKYTMGFSAVAQFNRSEFGLDKYIPLVGDEIEIEVYAEFQKQ